MSKALYTEESQTHEAANQKNSAGINMGKVISKVNKTKLPTNSEGQIILNRDNPRHMEWIKE